MRAKMRRRRMAARGKGWNEDEGRAAVEATRRGAGICHRQFDGIVKINERIPAPRKCRELLFSSRGGRRFAPGVTLFRNHASSGTRENGNRVGIYLARREKRRSARCRVQRLEFPRTNRCVPIADVSVDELRLRCQTVSMSSSSV